jgi:tetratricopeptide (TPR) repeat protein
MSFMNKVVGGLLLVLTLGLTAQAQGNKKAPRGHKPQGGKGNFLPTPDQQSALVALDQLSEAAKGFDDDLLRIRTQAHAADILWPYDEPRARRQLEEAFRAVMSVKTASPNSLTSPGVPSAQFSPLSELQNEVLALVSRRDTDLADRLIKSLAGDSSDKDSRTKAGTSAERNVRYDLYLKAALSIAESDPERAAQLAKASLGGGISPDIIKVLLVLRSANAAAADSVFSAALTVARQDISHAPANVAMLAYYALPELATMGGGVSPSQDAGATSQPAPPVVREFLNFAYDTFLQLSGVAAQLGLPGADYGPASSNPMDYMTGQRLLPSFARYMPERAATFRQAVDALARNVQQTKETDAMGKMFQQGGGADEMLEQAQSEQNKFLKDLLYARAAIAALTSGDFDRALSIVEKMGNEDLRANLDSSIRLQASAAALKKEDVDSALRYAEGVSDLRQRAYLYGTIARALLDKDNAVRAAEVLDEAERVISKADGDTAIKANALLIVAEVKARLDPVRGFEALGVAVKAFNRADSSEANKGKGATSAGTDNALSAALNSALKIDVPNFDPIFSRLAKADFNRAIQLARELDKQERTVMAQLAAFRGALVPARKKAAQAVRGREGGAKATP